MKKLKLYLITPLITASVMYLAGWLRLKVVNPYHWGDKTLIFLISAGILIYLSILRIEIELKSDTRKIMEGVFVIAFIVCGFWALFLYYCFTPRI